MKSKPGTDIKCPICGYLYYPIYDTLEKKWYGKCRCNESVMITDAVLTMLWPKGEIMEKKSHAV